MGLLLQRKGSPVFFLLLLAVPLAEVPPATVLWAGPAILVAAIAIAWAAESAQYFIAQGFALAILAWLQTLPSSQWRRSWRGISRSSSCWRTHGALRLLTGFGWPVIYFTAAMFQRKRGGEPLKAIRLEEHHAWKCWAWPRRCCTWG
jgi:hypothetical protein